MAGELCKWKSVKMATFLKRIFLMGILVTLVLVFFLLPLKNSLNGFHRLKDDIVSLELADDYFSNTSKVSFFDVIEEVQRKIPSLPNIIFDDTTRCRGTNETCALFPTIFKINYNNLYWQSLPTYNGTFILFGAYLDVRQEPVIRILGVYDRVSPTIKTYCQIWYKYLEKPVVVETSNYTYIWHVAWGNGINGEDQPYLITCPIPFEQQHLVPDSVSLVVDPCDNSTNNLKVFYEQVREKKDVAVCVKSLDFPFEDISVRLAEWIELIRILGAEKIFFYNLSVHPNVSKLLDYYENKGIVQITQFTLPGKGPNLPHLQHIYLRTEQGRKRQIELIPYNDCLYKNINKYRYLTLLDIDEVIVPTTGDWHDLLEKLQGADVGAKRNDTSHYAARNAYFLSIFMKNQPYFKDIPNYMHMLQHVYRTANYSLPLYYVKCFHNTEKVVSVHNHFPRTCFNKCRKFEIPTDLGHLQHYRANCMNDSKHSCKELKKTVILDDRIWRFAPDLISRVQQTLKDLNYFKV